MLDVCFKSNSENISMIESFGNHKLAFILIAVVVFLNIIDLIR